MQHATCSSGMGGGCFTTPPIFSNGKKDAKKCISCLFFYTNFTFLPVHPWSELGFSCRRCGCCGLLLLLLLLALLLLFLALLLLLLLALLLLFF